jgi:hypothetical protein
MTLDDLLGAPWCFGPMRRTVGAGRRQEPESDFIAGRTADPNCR